MAASPPGSEIIMMLNTGFIIVRDIIRIIGGVIGTSVRQSRGHRSGGRLLAMTSWPLKTPFFSFSFFSSPSSTFLIEGVLGSKNLFSES